MVTKKKKKKTARAEFIKTNNTALDNSNIPYIYVFLAETEQIEDSVGPGYIFDPGKRVP